MSDRNELFDEELRSVLRRWQAPEAPPSLDRRVASSFSAQRLKSALWRRILTATVAVPMPVAAAVALLFIGAGVFAVRNPRPAPAPTAEPVIKTRTVEIPVVREKVVTRTVYVERKSRPLRQRAAPDATALTSGDERGFMNLAGFQPPKEIKLRVIGKGDDHEN